LRDPKHKTSDGKIKQFDRVVMNPPFSLKDWRSEDFTDGDPFDRFGYGSPPTDNGDYAWMTCREIAQARWQSHRRHVASHLVSRPA
jgi:type I restriction-modification system DNA methylase subunit